MLIMGKVFFLIFTFLPFGFSQKQINLNSLKAKSTTEIDVEGPYSLYVSASSDSMSRLSQIFVNSSHNQLISLYQLKMNKMNRNSGFLQPYRIMKTASIISNLTDIDMRFLTGFLYITTRRQMNDNSFYVYDVDQEQTITVDENKPENCTLVFLNSNSSTELYSSSTLSNWVQSENSSVFVYPGIPNKGIAKPYSQIFSNPVSTTDGMKFFSYIETFSINLPIFYIKVHKGVEFNITPEFHNINGTTTSFPTTTGFYMKPFGQSDRKIFINMVTVNSLISSVNGSLTGANTIGFVSNDSTVSVDSTKLGGANGFSVKPVDQILGWSTPEYGESIVISSKTTTSGQFFIQYYVIH